MRKISLDCIVEMKSLLLTTNDEVICGDNMKDATVGSMDGLQIIRRFVMLEIHKKTLQAFANVFGQGWPGVTGRCLVMRGLWIGP